MPNKGQKSVTLPESVYELARTLAKKQSKSIAGFVTELIKEETKEGPS